LSSKRPWKSGGDADAAFVNEALDLSIAKAGRIGLRLGHGIEPV
jgi:hypothetical protein